jgi:hypothetical protein
MAIVSRAFLGVVLVISLVSCTAQVPPTDLPGRGATAASLPPVASAAASPAESFAPNSGPTRFPLPSPTSAPTPTSSLDPTVAPTAGAIDADAIAALLPASIEGQSYQLSSGTVQVDELGGTDSCFIFCPQEFVRYADRLGVDRGPLLVATAFPSDQKAKSAVWIYALRLDGADPRKLVSAWVTRLSPDAVGMSRTIGGKEVVVDASYGRAADFIYARSGVLFLVFAQVPDPGATPRIVHAAFAMLP